MTDLTPDLQFLLGEPISGVCFVTDYVELHFNGSYLRCLAPPTVRRGSQLPVAFPGPGSRDALCALIGAEVRAIRAEDGGELHVELTDGTIVAASLAHEVYNGPDVLHFHNQATGETQWW